MSTTTFRLTECYWDKVTSANLAWISQRLMSPYGPNIVSVDSQSQNLRWTVICCKARDRSVTDTIVMSLALKLMIIHDAVWEHGILQLHDPHCCSFLRSFRFGRPGSAIERWNLACSLNLWALWRCSRIVRNFATQWILHQSLTIALVKAMKIPYLSYVAWQCFPDLVHTNSFQLTSLTAFPRIQWAEVSYSQIASCL